MTIDLFLALIAFAVVSSITPGPNNIMLMASGANFGFRRTVPHMLGISIGFMVMMSTAGLGLSQVFDLYPVSHRILQVISVAYLLYLAWKIANAAPPKNAVDNVQARPFTFMQAALFQWVNPKAWTMALTAITVYAVQRDFLSIFTLSAVFAIVNLPSVSVWTLMGQQLARLLTSRARLRVFNWTMAGLLVASLIPVVLS